MFIGWLVTASLLSGSQTMMVHMGDGEPLCNFYFWPAFTCSESNHSSFDQGCIWSIITHSICMKLLQNRIWIVIIFKKKKKASHCSTGLKSLNSLNITFPTALSLLIQFAQILIQACNICAVSHWKWAWFTIMKNCINFIILKCIDINTGN